MTRTTRLILFVVLCGAQLFGAVSGIARYERTLAEGELYRFACAPVDPEDPFRGRYVQLGFAASNVEGVVASSRSGHPAYAVLGVDDAGYAKVTELTDERPLDGDYVPIRPGVLGEGTFVRFPFDRYFMEESLAPDAESLVRRAGWDREETAYLEVRILDGQPITQGLFVDGVAIEDYVRQRQQK